MTLLFLRRLKRAKSIRTPERYVLKNFVQKKTVRTIGWYFFHARFRRNHLLGEFFFKFFYSHFVLHV